MESEQHQHRERELAQKHEIELLQLQQRERERQREIETQLEHYKFMLEKERKPERSGLQEQEKRDRELMLREAALDVRENHINDMPPLKIAPPVPVRDIASASFGRNLSPSSSSSSSYSPPSLSPRNVSGAMSFPHPNRRHQDPTIASLANIMCSNAMPQVTSPPEELEKMERIRAAIIAEIIETEKTYLAGLLKIRDVY